MDNPKILFFDIETAPHLGYVWEKWETNVIAFEEYGYILSFSAKWYGGKQITKGLIDYQGYRKNKKNDREIVKELWKLFDEADFLVAHNGDQFDIKKCNSRFSYYNLPPPRPYRSIDTKKMAKGRFGFVSNSLDDLGDYLGMGRKVSTGGFDLWRKCMAGDKEAWKKMKKYNAQDVNLLEKIYLHLRPYMKNPVFHDEEGVCPKCGSKRFQKRGFSVNAGVVRQRFQCMDCGGWSHSAKGERIGYPNKNI